MNAIRASEPSDGALRQDPREVRIGPCSECRHWVRRDARSDSALWESDADQAANREAYEQWGRCRLALSDGGKPRFSETKAYATDYENYKADFLTREDFGCVQWAREEAASTPARLTPSGAGKANGSAEKES